MKPEYELKPISNHIKKWKQSKLELLGINWPPKKGWIKTVINLEVSDFIHDELLRLRAKPPKDIHHKVLLRKMKRIEKEVNEIGGKVFWDIK